MGIKPSSTPAWVKSQAPNNKSAAGGSKFQLSMTKTTTSAGLGFWNNTAPVKARPILFKASDTTDLLHSKTCLGFEIYLEFMIWNLGFSKLNVGVGATLNSSWVL